jgi:hypothetical protein
VRKSGTWQKEAEGVPVKIKVSKQTYNLIKEMQRRMTEYDKGDPDCDPDTKITKDLVITRCICNPAYLIRCYPELGEAEQIRSEISSLSDEVEKLKARKGKK